MDAKVILSVCIAAYFGIAVFAFWLNSLRDFWILAVCVGMFQGTIQAISRSYYTKIIPAERAGEFFGIYDICGKGAAFTGTLLDFCNQPADGQHQRRCGLPVGEFLLGLSCSALQPASVKAYRNVRELLHTVFVKCAASLTGCVLFRC